MLRAYTDLTCRIDAPGLKDFPARGPLIAISNHTGQIEVPLLFSHLQPRLITGWAKEELWDHAFLGWVLNVWHVVPVRRGEADTSALRQALRMLEQGYIFGLAPEGTRNRSGKLNRAMPGAAVLAIRSGAPVIPIAHWGGENYRNNLKRLRRTDFHVRIGRPFHVRTEDAKVSGEVRQQIVDEMMFELAALLPQEYRGEYANSSAAGPRFVRHLT